MLEPGHRASQGQAHTVSKKGTFNTVPGSYPSGSLSAGSSAARPHQRHRRSFPGFHLLTRETDWPQAVGSPMAAHPVLPDSSVGVFQMGSPLSLRGIAQYQATFMARAMCITPPVLPIALAARLPCGLYDHFTNRRKRK